MNLQMGLFMSKVARYLFGRVTAVVRDSKGDWRQCKLVQRAALSVTIK